jgi:hypothetical protein
MEFFTHYPSRLLWAGGGLLFAFACVSSILLLPVIDQPHFPQRPRRAAYTETLPSMPSLLGSKDSLPFSLEKLREILGGEMSVSESPSRPGFLDEPVAHLRLKGTGQFKDISLPGRAYLAFNERGVLTFSDAGDFWLDLSMGTEQRFSEVLTVLWEGKEALLPFVQGASEPHAQRGEEFAPGSLWQILGDAKWWGADAPSQLVSNEIKQRIEIGSIRMELSPQDWIYWQEGSWRKGQGGEARGEEAHSDKPIARIRKISEQQLEWDVWTSLELLRGEPPYARLKIPMQAPPQAPRPKIEDWVTSLRIRSEKQISCILEKQCLVLHAGAWILKENGRWRILRKSEEKDDFVLGKRTGDLLVLEQIDTKQGTVKGRFLAANRIQVFPFELAALNGKRLLREKRSGRAT